MTSRDRVIRTLNHQPVDRAPRDLWLAHSIESGWTDALAELNVRFPSDMAQIDLRTVAGKRHKPGGRPEPSPIDAWGCTAAVEGRGAAGAAAPPLADDQQIAAYCPPAELLAPARFSAVNRGCAGTTRFTLAWSDVPAVRTHAGPPRCGKRPGRPERRKKGKPPAAGEAPRAFPPRNGTLGRNGS